MEAQEPVSVHLSEKDGLPDIEFYNIIEDSKGFIWLCADKGLYRYDGKEFKNYSNKEKRGLSVFEPQEDHLGRVWCNNISGQFFYVENNMLVTFIDMQNYLKGELADYVVTKNALIVFTMKSIFTIDLKSKIITLKSKADNRYGKPTYESEYIYCSTVDRLAILNDKTLQVENNINLILPPENSKGKINLNGKSELFKLGSNLFLCHEIFNDNRFLQIDENEHSSIEVKGLERLKEMRTLNFFEYKNKLWVSSNKGVHVFLFNGAIFNYEKTFLKDQFVTKIIKDKDDNFWFTTLTNGVFVIPNIYIEELNISEDNKNISALDIIDDSTLFFGTNSGDVVFYNLETSLEKTINLPSLARVSSIKYFPPKDLCYVSKDDSGFLVNQNTDSFVKSKGIYTVKSFSVVGDKDLLYVNYSKVMLAKEGNIDNSAFYISSGKRTYTSFHSKTHKETYVAFVDDFIVYNSIWEQKSIRYKDQPIFVISISETQDGVIWVGTFKDGVFGIKNGEVITKYDETNGLTSNQIYKIKGDGNDLWIATDAGIQKLDIVSNTFQTLTKRDGAVSYNISGIEIVKNKIIFASNKGLFSLEKDKAFKQQSIPEIYFETIEINEKQKAIKSHFNLDYNQNAVKFNFNVNGFQYNQKEIYKYRLLGFNDTWAITETGVNSVKYNSLPAGNYTFQVKPSGGINESEEAIKQITLSIKNPFWKKGWFIVCCALLFALLISLYFRKKITKKEEERKKQMKQLSLDNELIALKLENLRSQMNPHFIFNALNSIQEYIVLNQKKLASEYLGKFADLIRTYLNHSTKGSITLQEEIDCLEMYLELEKLRFEDKLHYTISTSGSLSPDHLHIPTMLIQPYVENALKHGLLHRKTDRKLKIGFFINDDSNTVKCMIVDNGVGRDKAKAFKARSHKNHTSFATKATKDRLDLLNYGKLKKAGVTIVDLFENEVPTGTQVTIIIPFTTH